MLGCEGLMSEGKCHLVAFVTGGVSAGLSRHPRRHAQGFLFTWESENLLRGKVNREA